MSLAAYLVRHGEVDHHRTDISITERGRAQAAAAGESLATHIGGGDTVWLCHSPVARVVETADLLRQSLLATLSRDGLQAQVRVMPSQLDAALHNVRFIVSEAREPQEPSLLYGQMMTTAYLQSVPSAQAEFYRGFWTSTDPMGYWLTHDSVGAAESPQMVRDRLLSKLRELFASDLNGAARTHWIGVTHSGAMRVLLNHVMRRDPGEPEFCEVIAVQPPAAGASPTLVFRGQSYAIF